MVAEQRCTVSLPAGCAAKGTGPAGCAAKGAGIFTIELWVQVRDGIRAS